MSFNWREKYSEKERFFSNKIVKIKIVLNFKFLHTLMDTIYKYIRNV